MDATVYKKNIYLFHILHTVLKYRKAISKNLQFDVTYYFYCFLYYISSEVGSLAALRLLFKHQMGNF